MFNHLCKVVSSPAGLCPCLSYGVHSLLHRDNIQYSLLSGLPLFVFSNKFYFHQKRQCDSILNDFSLVMPASSLELNHHRYHNNASFSALCKTCVNFLTFLNTFLIISIYLQEKNNRRDDYLHSLHISCISAISRMALQILLSLYMTVYLYVL